MLQTLFGRVLRDLLLENKEYGENRPRSNLNKYNVTMQKLTNVTHYTNS